MTAAVEPRAGIPGSRASSDPPRIILRGIPWLLYLQLRRADENRGVRMSYWNGTLELMSPEYVHEQADRRLTQLIVEVVTQRDIPCACAGSTTFRRPGQDEEQGAGKEPDTSFYFAHEPSIRGKKTIDLETDPPPDLAVEVDNTTDSARKLPIYAALGVPEVWRFDVNTGELWFGKLQPDGTYAAIEQSECLPMLTPALVLEALSLAEGDTETRWFQRLRDWVRDRLR
jgi:Uma2 family endonuclease